MQLYRSPPTDSWFWSGAFFPPQVSRGLSKQELGLGHFEGRNWRGFHHHATLSIAAYGFLVLERCLFSPSGESRSIEAANIQLQLPRVQSDYTPRGATRTHRTA